MTKIGLIRHGITQWNREGREQGGLDIPLDSEGVEQAERLADRLEQEHWDIIYASDLLRARQTAEIVRKKLNEVPMKLDKRLRERGSGQIEGTTEEERIAKWGSGWKQLDLGMEARKDVEKRGISLLTEVLSEHEGKNILFITHGSFIAELLFKLILAKQWEPVKNTSVTELAAGNKSWECRLYNCTEHLAKEKL